MNIFEVFAVVVALLFWNNVAASAEDNQLARIGPLAAHNDGTFLSY